MFESDETGFSSALYFYFPRWLRKSVKSFITSEMLFGIGIIHITALLPQKAYYQKVFNAKRIFKA